ncbi:MAG: glycosyltransferase [Bacteroidales bacterium]
MTCFIAGWERLERITLRKHTLASCFSIIIPVRNEQENILKLLFSLKMQNYDQRAYRLIIVDDHSTDGTVQRVKKFINKYPAMDIQLFVLPENKYTKKAALEYGIRQADGEAIIMMDADCEAGVDYLKTLNEYYRRKAPKLLLAPVRINSRNNVFAAFQALEFSSLVFTAAGSSGINRAIMGNGANLLVDRSVFKKLQDQDVFLDKYASGDDMFLLEFVKKNFGKHSVAFAKHPQAVVTTQPCENAAGFFIQRRRWVSKSKAYKNPLLITVALIVFLVAVVQVPGLLSAFFIPRFLYVVAAVWAIKVIADSIILMRITRFLGQKQLRKYIFPLSFIYPFYVIYAAMSGWIFDFSWKGRKYKE